MIGLFFSYFIIFFVIARLVSLLGKIKWMPIAKTTTKRDAVLAIVFSLIVVAMAQIGKYTS
ncbi:hypothetical protein [Priestia abyssalis]|uniref:hypothetical protein n=1 Tax=Priestia abyssalis TaxID=1221450 RepID=UPI00099535FA|nr:hypothetical protein [Priestia abyssalis]